MGQRGGRQACSSSSSSRSRSSNRCACEAGSVNLIGAGILPRKGHVRSQSQATPAGAAQSLYGYHSPQTCQVTKMLGSTEVLLCDASPESPLACVLLSPAPSSCVGDLPALLVRRRRPQAAVSGGRVLRGMAAGWGVAGWVRRLLKLKLL